MFKEPTLPPQIDPRLWANVRTHLLIDRSPHAEALSFIEELVHNTNSESARMRYY